MILSTSNKNKIREFKNFLGDSIEIVDGKDLPEVFGTVDEVIKYKSLDAGKDFIVEDTILIINGEEVVDIKWKQNELNEGDKATWITSLGYNNGEEIIIYRGIQNGIITKTKGTEGFAFDPYFIPEEIFNITSETLKELDNRGKKDMFSARIKALTNLQNNIEEFRIKISDLPKWEGKYQNE